MKLYTLFSLIFFTVCGQAHDYQKCDDLYRSCINEKGGSYKFSSYSERTTVCESIIQELDGCERFPVCPTDDCKGSADFLAKLEALRKKIARDSRKVQ